MSKWPEPRGSYFISYVIGANVCTLIMLIFFTFNQQPKGPTCEEKAVRVWAIQQCLRWQPACQMKPGPELFMEYHNFKRDVRENCPEKSVSGYQLEIK